MLQKMLRRDPIAFASTPGRKPAPLRGLAGWRAGGLATRLLKFQSLKSIGRMHEELILAGALRIRLGVQEAAQFTPVHLVHQFTKLADHRLTKRHGFPSPYRFDIHRVPRHSSNRPHQTIFEPILAGGFADSWARVRSGVSSQSAAGVSGASLRITN